jgi:hypothetical protein
MNFVSLEGLGVSAVELLYFGPVVLTTLLWPRRAPVCTCPVRALVRASAVAVCVLFCLFTAETWLRNTSVVAWLESQIAPQVAVTSQRGR